MSSDEPEPRRGLIRASWILPLVLGALPWIRDGLVWLISTESSRQTVSLMLNGAVISIVLAAVLVVGGDWLRRRRLDRDHTGADEQR